MKNDFMSKIRESRRKIDESQEKAINIEQNIKQLHAEAVVPRPLMIDEVAFAFIAALRVSSWESLGDEFSGYKYGYLFAYILSVLNEKIEESTVATIKVDVPLYEQDLNKEKEEEFCAYCKKSDGTINHDVFIEVDDAELGMVWVCKKCFLQTARECAKERIRLQKENDRYFYTLNSLKEIIQCGKVEGFSNERIEKMNNIISKVFNSKEKI